MTIALGAIALAFFGYALVSSWRDFDSSNFAPNATWTIPIAFFTLATFISGFLWGAVVRTFTGATMLVRETLESHLGAWVMRYVPTVGYFSYKSIQLGAKGLRLRLASVPILFEGVYVQITSLVVGVALLAPALMRVEGISSLFSATALFGLLFVALFFLRPFLTATILRLSVTERVLDTKTTATELRLFVYYLIPRLVTAAAAASTAVSVEWETKLDGQIIGGTVTVAGAFVIAAALGVLVPFVPSGLGIREGVFVGLLVSLGGNVSSAVALSIILRFLSTLSDCLIAIFWAWLRRRIALDRV